MKTNFRSITGFLTVIFFKTVLFTLIFSVNPAFSQDNLKKKEARIMFYNVENLYDPFNDSITEDDDFTFSGKQHWSYTKYRKKLFNISKVIIAVGGWSPPVMVGLAEIENAFVLRQLVGDSPLKKYNLKFLHKDSPDPRGVDVALVYDPERYKPLEEEYLRIRFPFDTAARTRDILYSKGLLMNTDTVHVFVNHWPSNYGGAASSAPRRQFVARLLKHKVDSIFRYNQKANIIIMGDMNEGPEADNISELVNISDSTKLISLMKNTKTVHGSHKYRGNWDIIDQIIVSPSLIPATSEISITNYSIFDKDFLLEEDTQNTGTKAFRTYSGPVYKGGYSDHLPVYLDLIVARHK